MVSPAISSSSIFALLSQSPLAWLPAHLIKLPLSALQAQTSCQLPYPERFSEAAKFVAERECGSMISVGGRRCSRGGRERGRQCTAVCFRPAGPRVSGYCAALAPG